MGRKERILRVGDVLDKVLTDLGLQGIMRASEVKEAWSVVASTFVHKAKALEFREGTLWVGVKGASLRQEMEMRKGEFLEKFRDMGFKDVEEIRWVNWREG